MASLLYVLRVLSNHHNMFFSVLGEFQLTRCYIETKTASVIPVQSVCYHDFVVLSLKHWNISILIAGLCRLYNFRGSPRDDF